MARAVCFDVWDTLLDNSKFYVRISEEIARLCDRDPERVYRDVISWHRRAKRARLLGHLGEDVVRSSTEMLSTDLGVGEEVLRRALAETFLRIDPKDLVIEGAMDTIKEIRRMGFKVACLGNVLFWPGAMTRMLLAGSGLLDHIDVSIFADEIGARKPDRRAFEKVASRLGVNLSDLVHVGDSLADDFAGAIMAGARAVLIDPNADGVTVMGGRGLVIRSIRDLPKEIGRII